ncbi:MAG: hypothetical protein ACTSUE_12205 [Promethearchaeota archaeon]
MGKLNFSARVSGTLAAFMAGLIFLYSGITGLPFFGEKWLDMVGDYYPGISPAVQEGIASYLSIMGMIADYTGLVVLVAAFLIFTGRGKMANIVLMLTMAVGLFGFATPVISALFQGGEALGIALDSLASKYVVAVLLAMVAKKNAEDL